MARSGRISFSLFVPLEDESRFKIAAIVAANPVSYTRRSATISERCLSGLDQIYSYEFQKALDSSPKRSLLVDAAPKIRVLAVGLLVDAFVQLPRYPRRRARESGIAMAPIPSRREVLGVSLRRNKNPNNFFSQGKHVKLEN